jgi:hypothetical protein
MQVDNVISGSQRRILDNVIPIVTAFAEVYGGTLRHTKDGMDIRILTARGMITIQINTRRQGSDHKLEITGIQRSGIETKRSIIIIKNEKVEDKSILEALDLALGK